MMLLLQSTGHSARSTGSSTTNKRVLVCGQIWSGFKFEGRDGHASKSVRLPAGEGQIRD